MYKVIRGRLAIIPAFIAAILTATIAAIILSGALITMPVTAAPPAQPTLPNFILNAQTVLTITVAITDGQVIVVPVDLAFLIQNRGGATDVSLIADVEQQAGLFIGVAPSDAISATIQLPQAATATPTVPASPAAQVVTGNGTHVANTNSNQRAGPGTRFAVVGRVPAGDAVTVVGENADGTWLQLDNGNWIAAFLLDPIEGNSDNNSNNDEDDSGVDASEESEDESATAPTGVPAALADQAAPANYLLEVAAIGAEASNAVAALTDLIQNPQPLDPAWRNDVAAQLALLSAALDQYLALTPVPGYEDLHAQITEVALTCEQAVDYLVTGLENPRAIDPALATQSVQACAVQAADLAAYVDTLP